MIYVYLFVIKNTSITWVLTSKWPKKIETRITIYVNERKKEFPSFWSGNYRIFLSLRFYVKSILNNLEVLKMPVLPYVHIRVSFCLLGKISVFKKGKNSWTSVFRSVKKKGFFPSFRFYVKSKFVNLQTQNFDFT